MFIALVIRHSVRMRRIILPSVACPAPQYFPTLSQERLGFRKRVIEHKKFFDFIVSTTLVSLGSTQPLTWLTTLPLPCAVVMNSGNPNFLEPSGPLQACNGTDLPLPYNSCLKRI